MLSTTLLSGNPFPVMSPAPPQPLTPLESRIPLTAVVAPSSLHFVMELEHSLCTLHTQVVCMCVVRVWLNLLFCMSQELYSAAYIYMAVCCCIVTCNSKEFKLSYLELSESCTRDIVWPDHPAFHCYR